MFVSTVIGTIGATIATIFLKVDASPAITDLETTRQWCQEFRAGEAELGKHRRHGCATLSSGVFFPSPLPTHIILKTSGFYIPSVLAQIFDCLM